MTLLRIPVGKKAHAINHSFAGKRAYQSVKPHSISGDFMLTF